jgi:acetolactate decarboxylase
MMKICLYITISFLILPEIQAQVVKYSGSMSKIRQQKRVDGEILVDTIALANLYALGPVENLRGEIIVWNNNAFVAALTEDKKPYVQKNVKDLKAIFLVYADVKNWDTVLISKHQISSISDLETFISKTAFLQGHDTSSAFPFQIFARAKQGSGHIMFKDTSITLITPEVLEKAKYTNSFTEQYIQMLGFYSQHHQTIFTHHDTFLHIHYRLRNKYQAGHLEELQLDPNYPIKLLFPQKQKP